MDIRDQFRKVSDDVGKAARGVADSSKKATSRARLRRAINQCSASLQEVYSEIGAQFFTEHQQNPEEPYTELFQNAEGLLEQIELLKAELAGLDDATICPGCGHTVEDAQKFCPECGCQNASYGKRKAEAEAAEAARQAAREAEQAERAARKAEKEAQAAIYETTAEAVPTDEAEFPPTDATVYTEED